LVKVLANLNLSGKICALALPQVTFINSSQRTLLPQTDGGHMKIIARITMCMVFVFLLASFAPAQRKKTAVSRKVMNDIFRQLFVDCKAAAPSPESWDEIKIDRPVNDYIDVELIPLSPGKITYLITGKQDPFYGAHAEMYWIYEKTASGYRQVDALGANYSVGLLRSSHNGYRDLATTYISGAGTVLDTCKLIFNGRKYVSAGCRSRRLSR
jgi:hypothetical protein